MGDAQRERKKGKKGSSSFLFATKAFVPTKGKNKGPPKRHSGNGSIKEEGKEGEGRKKDEESSNNQAGRWTF